VQSLRTASGRFGVPGPFAFFNDDGTRIWNGDAADYAGSPFKGVRLLDRSRGSAPPERSSESDPLDRLL